ncbi:MAG: hypothetical protein ACU0B7_06080 [Paracoccaceae bacterium]|uniref:hypothetical protein n=1 Tax=Seohaeicola saemankumensis TaxID=481181 RepID=UPI001E2E65DE|nr:hypothetical protein [Seohaeicola saemankumensis]
MRTGTPFALLLVLLLAMMPAQAQMNDAPSRPTEEGGSPDEGLSLMERGARMFLEGLRRDMSPALEDLRDLVAGMGPAMQDFIQRMGPAMTELLDRIDDLSVYEAPELLPNGDIIIRRKPDAGPLPPPAEGEIDI